MANWTVVEGPLADGLPMRVYLAEHDGKLWATRLSDDGHPCMEDEFVSRLAKGVCWQRREKGAASVTLKDAISEVEDYFAGRRVEFSVPLQLKGTPFQLRVWQQLQEIPFGTTCSYGDLARTIGHPTAFRAVGGANGCNRLPVFVPCHRVLATAGKLGGFTGGIGLKKRLLAHEAAVVAARRGQSSALSCGTGVQLALDQGKKTVFVF